MDLEAVDGQERTALTHRAADDAEALAGGGGGLRLLEAGGLSWRATLEFGGGGGRRGGGNNCAGGGRHARVRAW